MRGKVIVPHWRFLVNRITPAHAGKRLFILYHHYILWDHPRTCGEKVERHVRQQLKKGSPPHMRGKVKKHPFFPACQQDHPRTCGEKVRRTRGLYLILGSPPHMRGKVPPPAVVVPLMGITPAHAGKRSASAAAPAGQRDHPRTCGEKAAFHAWLCCMRGSPPHMRGKGPSVVYSVCKERITPAHAGKRSETLNPVAMHRDHPRTCGEKPFHLGGKCCIRGSPPHMRGKDVIVVFHEPLRRITPAHAGKRLKRSRSIVPHAAIVPLFPSVCNKPAGSDGSPAGHDAPPFLPIENAAPASPAYNLRSL